MRGRESAEQAGRGSNMSSAARFGSEQDFGLWYLKRVEGVLSCE
jgi:hypothetical protein